LSTGITVAFFFLPWMWFGPLRGISYIMVPASPLACITFERLVGKAARPRSGVFLAGLLVLVFVALAMSFAASAIPSPWILLPNQQVTAEEIVGMHWLFIRRVPHYPSIRIAMEEASFWSFISADMDKPFDMAAAGYERTIDAPNHFEMELLPDQWYRNGANLIVSQFDISCYVHLWPEANRFTSEDFDKLRSWSLFSLIYSSDGFWVYSVVT